MPKLLAKLNKLSITNMIEIATLPAKVNTSAEISNIEQLKIDHDFYDCEIDKSTGKFKEIHFDRLKLTNKLKSLGFFRYDLPDGAYQYIYISDNKLKIVQPYYIRDVFEDYIINMEPLQHEFIIEETPTFITVTSKMILSKMYKSIKTYFSPEYLERLRPEKKIIIQEDTESTKYIFFQNSFVEISKSGIISKSYSQLDNYIFEGSMLRREFLYTTTKGDFEKFIEKVTGKDTDRKHSLMSLIGYMMHGYFETKLIMLLLTDVNKDGTGEANGGTGKSLIGKAIGKMINATKDDSRYVELDGKIFDPANSKKYMNANIDTRLIHINDALKYFPVDRLYNDITEGITVHKHHAAPYVVPTKMIMSTNQTLKIDGTSSKRRIIFFELHNYYSDKLDPEMDFGKRFFESGWTVDDWNEFDSFMIRCVSDYLQSGIIKTAEINYSNRALEEHTDIDFVLWFEWLLKDREVLKMSEINGEYAMSKKNLFKEFITKYSDFDNPKFKQKKFTAWVRSFCEKKHINIIERRCTDDEFVFLK
ncbi:MAG: hypothetical protein Q7U47_01390 [Paludibacter sp.]|nr:hypothetical protein [Paludibacter sp.]